MADKNKDTELPLNDEGQESAPEQEGQGAEKPEQPAQDSDALVAQAIASLAQGQQKMDARMSKMETVLEALQGLAAKNRPIRRTARGLDMGEAMEGKDREVEETNEGLIVPVNEAEGEDRDFLEMEAFMHEMVLVEVAPSSDPEEHDIVWFGWNGRNYPFKRGQPRWVPRGVVAVMAHSIEQRYKSHDTGDPERENRFKYLQFKGMRFQFAVLEDSPIGLEWGRRLRSQEGIHR